MTVARAATQCAPLARPNARLWRDACEDTMAEGLNRVMLLGNLGADPELRFTQGGQAVLNLRLATTESYLDKDRVRKERTDWHSVVVWGKRGEALSKILAKGSSLFIEGSIRTSSYEDREGQKRYKTEIVANNVILAGRGAGGGGRAVVDESGHESRSGGPGGGGGGYGGGGGGRPQNRAPARDEAPADPGGGAAPPDDFNYGSDDDIPF